MAGARSHRGEGSQDDPAKSIGETACKSQCVPGMLKGTHILERLHTVDEDIIYIYIEREREKKTKCVFVCSIAKQRLQAFVLLR